MDTERSQLVEFLKQKSVPELINWLISNLTIQDIYSCLKKYNIDVDIADESQSQSQQLTIPYSATSRSGSSSSSSSSSRSTGPKSGPRYSSGSSGSLQSTMSDDEMFTNLPTPGSGGILPRITPPPPRFTPPPSQKRKFHNWYYPPDDYGNFIHYLMYISRDAYPVPIAVLPIGYTLIQKDKTAFPYNILCIRISDDIRKRTSATITFKDLKRYTYEELMEKYNILKNKPFKHIALLKKPLTAQKVVKLYETFWKANDKSNDPIPYCYLLPYGFGNKFEGGFQFIYGHVARNKYNVDMHIKELEQRLKNTPCTLLGMYPNPYNSCEETYHIYNHEEKLVDDYTHEDLENKCYAKAGDLWNNKENLDRLQNGIPHLDRKNNLLNPPQPYNVAEIYHPRRVTYDPIEKEIVTRNGKAVKGYSYAPLPYAHKDEYYDKYNVQKYIDAANDEDECYDNYAKDNNVDIDQILYPTPAMKRTAESAETVRKFLTHYNINSTGMKFGKTPNSHKFLVYLFDEKNKDWMRSRDKKPKAQWKTMKQLADIVKYKEKHNMHKKVSKFGFENFMSFNDVYLDKKQFKYGKDIQFKPLPPNQFGYFKEYTKQNGFPVQRNGFQLYPLGKDAYFKGRHQGVSATFSEEFSKKRGLWKPQLNIQKAKQGPRPEFQFGHSCFGRARPNDYGKEWNSYTQRYQNGIPKSQYGYHGTQSVGTSFTGIVGYPALSRQTIQQRMIPPM